jgi:hypothetical protein
MKQVLLTLAFFGLMASLQPARADDPRAIQTPRRGGANEPERRPAYLGLGIEPLPAALASQLAGVVPAGQGVLIDRVAEGSPAAKAGLQPHDILLRYDDQALNSPEQLTRLVRRDDAGREVTLGYVRGGKSESCKVTLGEFHFPYEPELPRVFRLRPDERLRRMFEESESRSDNPAWATFDALKLTRLDGDRWRAEIEYRSRDGKPEKKTFEGTREELRKNLLAEKDLPENERNHLLRALNLHEPVFEFPFPPFGPRGPRF